MRARYVGALLLISTTTTDPERTYPWEKTHPKRPVQPAEIGPVVALRQAGGLHHRYELTSSLNIRYVLMILVDRSASIHCISAHSSGSQVLCANLPLDPLALSPFSRKTHQRATRNFR